MIYDYNMHSWSYKHIALVTTTRHSNTLFSNPNTVIYRYKLEYQKVKSIHSMYLDMSPSVINHRKLIKTHQHLNVGVGIEILRRSSTGHTRNFGLCTYRYRSKGYPQSPPRGRYPRRKRRH